MEDGTRVLERKGVEQVVNTFFKSAPRDLLENSLLVKLGDFEGYLIDIIMDIYKNIKEEDNEFTGRVGRIGR